MSSSDLAISVRGLSKEYQIAHEERHTTLGEKCMAKLRSPLSAFRSAPKETFQALHDVSFDVKKGEVVGIIGRNGAGKSTLLKILSRITEPTSGEIRLYGRVASLLEVGTGFHPELTGRENIYLNGAILGMRRAEIARRFDEIVAFAEIEKFLDTPVKRYSSGMYVRLAFAVAAHLEPEILIVDEVLAVGDAEFQKKCLGKMQQVSRGEGRTVLFVSHNMGAITSLCNRGVLLTRGHVAFVGEATAMIAEYIRNIRSNAAERSAMNRLGYGIVSARVGSPNSSHLDMKEPTFGPNDDVFLEFECQLPESSTLNLGFTVYSHDRDLPTMSASIRDSGATLPSGHQLARIRLPVERLVTGCYRIEAAVGDASAGYGQSDSLAFFHVVNTVHNKLGTMPRAGTLVAAPWDIASMTRDDLRTLEPTLGKSS